jgi:CheY-like chemotaxis protein
VVGGRVDAAPDDSGGFAVTADLPYAGRRMTAVIRVVLADDQPLVRAGLRMILRGEDDIEVVGEAANGADAVAICAEREPDVILMDVRMPEVDGIEATRRVASLPTRRGSSSSPPSTSTTWSTTRYGPEPAASCSRTPQRNG